MSFELELEGPAGLPRVPDPAKRNDAPLAIPNCTCKKIFHTTAGASCPACNLQMFEAMMDSMTYCNLFKENNDSMYI